MGYDADRAISKAREVVRQYNTRDPWALARKLPNVSVTMAELGNNIMGYTIVDRKFAIITLGEAMEETEATTVLGHEIGHSLLTRNTGTNYFYKNAGVPAVGSSEYTANCFMFQVLFGDRGGINLMNRNKILEQYGLPCWMTQYFDLID